MKTQKVRHIAGDNKFFRLEVHSVQVEGGGMIENWMYCDVPDMINVLLEDAATGRFLVFNQSKYSIPGRTLALLGGYIEPHESPMDAVVREVAEEVDMTCQDLIPLANGQALSASLSNLECLEKYKTVGGEVAEGGEVTWVLA